MDSSLFPQSVPCDLRVLVCRPKSNFLPSYIIDVRELDEKLLNIIDMKFLHGYYEPTLLILFEPNQTWPGSVLHRRRPRCEC